MHSKYSRSGSGNSYPTYACSKKPKCNSKRMRVSEWNERLWAALVELFMAPERIHSLLTPTTDGDLDTLKKQLSAIEKEQKVAAEKVARLLDLYLEGNIPQASYVTKSSQLETETERISLAKSELQTRIQNHGKQDTSDQLIQTIRLLSRSHRRFTEEQKVKVFRSLIKETRITASGVEFEMYVRPTQNVWWKYRQKKTRKTAPHGQTVRVGIPQKDVPASCVYTTGQVAKMLGISIDILRRRIERGTYPTPPRSSGNQRLFSDEHIRQLRALR
jgi:DNA-binding transcriptional MerR regulator